ncbi:MAG: hypothetical protein A2283_17810 [Lentisphaerae bacterium RIFOXYA12_FULL_48_11]|nr:MAG: hypothetical protein A2283_17810 [Lentisphaerae bacterium RIFOXYA12_FULL_48_11]
MLARSITGRARQGLGLQVEEVVAQARAAGLNLTPGRLRNIECGRTAPQPEEKTFLSQLYGISTFELFAEGKQ